MRSLKRICVNAIWVSEGQCGLHGVALIAGRGAGHVTLGAARIVRRGCDARRRARRRLRDASRGAECKRGVEREGESVPRRRNSLSEYE
jgi:hypothetical protein